MLFIAEMGFNPNVLFKDVLYNASCSFIFTEIKEMSCKFINEHSTTYSCRNLPQWYFQGVVNELGVGLS